MALVKCRECGKEVSTQAAACPNCGAKPRSHGKVQTVLGVIVLLVIGGAVIKAITHDDDAAPAASPSSSYVAPVLEATAVVATSAPAPPVALKVDAFDLFREYQANELRADQQFKGKVLAVTGMVQKISADFKNDAYLSLRTTNQFESVHADLEKSEIARASQLSQGETVDLVCTGGGMIIGSPVLRDCRFAAAAPPPQPLAVEASPAPSPATALAAAAPPATATEQTVVSHPSFDCTKARSTVELMICADPELGDRDRALAAEYSAAKTVAPDDRQFKDDTRQAWNYREKNCADKTCLLNWYSEQDQRFASITAAARASATGSTIGAAAPTLQIPPAAGARSKAQQDCEVLASEMGTVATWRDTGVPVETARSRVGAVLNQLAMPAASQSQWLDYVATLYQGNANQAAIYNPVLSGCLQTHARSASQ